jgi:hypothetical protein
MSFGLIGLRCFMFGINKLHDPDINRLRFHVIQQVTCKALQIKV